MTQRAARFNFGKTSKDRLALVHPDLQKLMTRALELSPIDFSISQGLRTRKEQETLYAQGRTQAALNAIGLTWVRPIKGDIVTWTMKSNHLSGLAIDVAALPHGVLSWNEKFYCDIAAAVQRAAHELMIHVIWGAVWDTPLNDLQDGLMSQEASAYKKRWEAANHPKKAKTDFPHFELDSKLYLTA